MFNSVLKLYYQEFECNTHDKIICYHQFQRYILQQDNKEIHWIDNREMVKCRQKKSFTRAKLKKCKDSK